MLFIARRFHMHDLINTLIYIYMLRIFVRFWQSLFLCQITTLILNTWHDPIKGLHHRSRKNKQPIRPV